jgi:hypothetical protein
MGALALADETARSLQHDDVIRSTTVGRRERLTKVFEHERPIAALSVANG